MTIPDQAKEALEWFERLYTGLPLSKIHVNNYEIITSLLKERAEEQKMVNVLYEDDTPSREWIVEGQTNEKDIHISEISDEDIEAIRNAKVPEEYDHLNRELKLDMKTLGAALESCLDELWDDWQSRHNRETFEKYFEWEIKALKQLQGETK